MDDAKGELPSGRWVGFYSYPHSPRRYRQDLRLEITAGRITGTGIDPEGRFLISGRVHPEGRVNCVKTYPGIRFQPDVLYAGFADHNGIWGTWTIPPFSSGGFRIWPASWGEGPAIKVEESEPVEEESPVADAVPVEARRGV